MVVVGAVVVVVGAVVVVVGAAVVVVVEVVLEVSGGLGFFFLGTWSAGSPVAAATAGRHLGVADLDHLGRLGPADAALDSSPPPAPAMPNAAANATIATPATMRSLTRLHCWSHLPAPSARCQPACRGEPSHSRAGAFRGVLHTPRRYFESL